MKNFIFIDGAVIRIDAILVVVTHKKAENNDGKPVSKVVLTNEQILFVAASTKEIYALIEAAENQTS